uniref:Uncharacterized protein n=1 Tax=CrAss-like virus sp. ctRQZ5 TaxID=2826824 RepID=A0A8S5LXZ6_9CAUD|nr:MAG TPA: hypothetical protein [CrAss-like virus sp. ctRQZ5]
MIPLLLSLLSKVPSNLAYVIISRFNMSGLRDKNHKGIFLSRPIIYLT